MAANPGGEADGSPLLDIAIVGCGIIGLHVSLGLIRRNIRVTVYEQAEELKEIGAGIGFSGTAKASMEVIDPRIADAVNRVGIKGGYPGWIDGHSQLDIKERPRDHFYDMCLDHREGFELNFCRRAELMSELLNCMPTGAIKLGKRVDTVIRQGNGGKVILSFCDGDVVEADAVIGCDGVKSRIRQTMLDPEDPAAVAHYAHESAYRCLISMDKILPAWGDATKFPMLFTGQDAHIIAYPVANYTYLNVAAFIRDDADWPDNNGHVVQASKRDMIKAFSNFGPAVRDLVEVVPEQQSRWGLFDTFDHPIRSYAFDQVALAGDAAHTSTPHLGAGAGMGVEDALVLVAVLEQVAASLVSKDVNRTKPEALTEAFRVYDEICRPRSQWLVAASRHQGQAAKGKICHEKIQEYQERVERVTFDFSGRETAHSAAARLRSRLS